MTDPTAVVSIDVEFFTHLPAYRNAVGNTDDPAIGLDALDAYLELFDSHDVTATFFVVGEIAESHPDAIARLADSGHEIGSHTHRHRHLSELDSEQRLDELSRSKEALESVVGTPVIGFRAPSFDTGPNHFEELADVGYEYDSSVAPCRSIPGWYGGDHTVRTPTTADQLEAGAPAEITELPIAVMPGLRLPLTGTWIRFFGVRYTLYGMRLLAKRGITPILYVHPWEFVDLPAVDGVPKRVYWRTGDWMQNVLTTIVSSEFEFITADSV